MFETIEGVKRPELFKVLLLDTDVLKPQVIQTGGGLEEWYRLVKCDLIDIQERQIDGVYYDFIVDDEALQKPRAKITALDKDGQPQLVGNLVICKHDGEGGETGLSDEEVKTLLDKIVVLTENAAEDPEQWLAITDVEY